MRFEEKGRKRSVFLNSPSAAKLKTIRELVAAATGFSEPRGDLLCAETLPFESTLETEPPIDPAAPVPALPSPLPPWLQKYTKDMPAGLLIGAAVGLALIVVLPILFLLFRKRKAAVAVAVTTDRALSQSEDAANTFEGQLANRAANQERLDTEALLALKLPPPNTKKSEVLTKHLKKSVKADPAVSAQLLRTWINENET